MSPAIAWTPELINQTINKIVERSTTDAQFRTLALSNPKAAIGKVTDAPIPENFTVRFVDGAGANMTFILPRPAAAEGELSDAQLEQVAGGRGGLSDVSSWFSNNLGPQNWKSAGLLMWTGQTSC
jgi:hypothetical protein